MTEEMGVLGARLPRLTMPDASDIADGQRLAVDGQIFTILRVDQCHRRDGTIRTMVTWSAPCADCGEIFYGASSCGGGLPTRRCISHRAAGRPVRRDGPPQRPKLALLPPEDCPSALFRSPDREGIPHD